MDSSALAVSFSVRGDEVLLLEVKKILNGELVMSALHPCSSGSVLLSFYGYLPDACRALSKYLVDSEGTRTLAYDRSTRMFLRDQQPESISELIVDNLLPWQGSLVVLEVDDAQGSSPGSI